MTNQDIAKQIIESEKQIQTSFDDLNKAAIELENAAAESASALNANKYKGGILIIILGVIVLMCAGVDVIFGIFGVIFIIIGGVVIHDNKKSCDVVEKKVSDCAEIINKAIGSEQSNTNN